VVIFVEMVRGGGGGERSARMIVLVLMLQILLCEGLEVEMNAFVCMTIMIRIRMQEYWNIFMIDGSVI